jgi:hypothetical protein
MNLHKVPQLKSEKVHKKPTASGGTCGSSYPCKTKMRALISGRGSFIPIFGASFPWRLTTPCNGSPRRAISNTHRPPKQKPIAPTWEKRLAFIVIFLCFSFHLKVKLDNIIWGIYTITCFAHKLLSIKTAKSHANFETYPKERYMI